MPIPEHILKHLNEKNILCVMVTPKASRNEILDWVTDENGQAWLKLRINAVPEDGKANKELLKFLAKTWNIPKSSLSIAAGETSRHKKIRIF